MDVIEMRLDEIRPYDRNPRRNCEAVEMVARSIEEFGFKVPIVVDADGTIVAGHTRYKAAKRLGIETVPCVVADDLTDAQVKAFRIADNRSSELATWDDDLLAAELSDLGDAGIDMADFGFDTDDGETREDAARDAADVDVSDIEQTYAISIECASEAEQKETYETLTDMGYTCRVAVV